MLFQVGLSVLSENLAISNFRTQELIANLILIFIVWAVELCNILMFWLLTHTSIFP